MKKLLKQNPKWSSLTIRKRLLLSFAFLSGIMLIYISIILYMVSSAKHFANDVVTTSLPNHNMISDIDENIYKLNAAQRGWFMTNEQSYKTEIEVTLATLDRFIAVIRTNNALGTNTANELIALYTLLKGDINKTISTGAKGSANELMKGTETLANKILTLLKGPLGVNGIRNGGALDSMDIKMKSDAGMIVYDMNVITFVLYFLLISCLIFSVAISLITASRILKPLNKAIKIAKNIAGGNRDNEIVVQTNDETGELLNSLKLMQAAIKEKETQLQHSEEQSRKLFENIVETANIFSMHSSKVASGDLTQQLEISKNDEMSQLGNDLNIMTQGLAKITKNIVEASNNMATTLQEVKQASDQQSAGVSEQAASINQITASLEEIDKSAAQTMEKAKILGQLAETTSEQGQVGLQAVFDSIEGMKAVRNKVETIAKNILDLSNQTQQVGEITAVVNTLAQQSKMLALNASIEAAKAGDSGKGFAVVATEIKNLAEQSEQSTVEVQRILEDIRRATEKAVLVTEEGTKGVDQGTSLVEQMGEIVRSLTQAIQETRIASQQIEAAVRQESLGIEQITTGMNEINQVTNSFVATVKQTSTSISELSGIAKNIKEYVDVYKVS